MSPGTQEKAGVTALPTHFAPAERASPPVLAEEVIATSNSALINALMETVGGLLAVLNEQRQVLAINPGMLRFLGVDDVAQVLGMRVGEAVHCIHAAEMPGGCGTSEYCMTCGQAIAVVTSLQDDCPAESICALTTREAGVEKNFQLRVRATPYRLGSWRVLLVFLQDITERHQRETLERAFYHDVRNTLTALQVTGELLRSSVDGTTEAGILAEDVVRLSRRVTAEVDLQRCLSESSMQHYRPLQEEHGVARLLDELHTLCVRHPAARDRLLVFARVAPGMTLTTDATVLLRVLHNVIVNALEATDERGTVNLRVHQEAEHLVFAVHNPGTIAPAVARRIFQRNFSTKTGTGRGMGTYAMKLLTEKCLGGTVTFTSDGGGTCFRVTVLQKLPPAPGI